MPRQRTRVLSSRAGVCPGCGQTAPQRLVETSFGRGAGLPFRRVYVPVTRAATCGACGDRYPVRAQDVSPAEAGRRRVGAAAGRDWAYPPPPDRRVAALPAGADR